MKIKPINNTSTLRKHTPTAEEVKAFSDKQEYRFANLYFLGTITFLIFISFTGLNAISSDYLFAALIAQIENIIPLWVYFVLANKKLGKVNRTGIHKMSVAKIFISIFMGISIIPFLNLINGISLYMVKDVTTQRVVESASKHNMFIMVLVVGIIPPIVEELSYRGAYFSAYRRAGVLKGALMSAFLFGLMHGNLNQFAYAFVAGFLFSMIVYAGGSVICTIIMHAIINSISVLSLYSSELPFKFPKVIVDTEASEITMKYIGGLVIPGLISLCLVMLGFYLLRKMNNAEQEEKPSKARIIDAPLIVGTIIMVINVIAAEIISRQL